jgi:serine/threonine-protein kinase
MTVAVSDTSRPRYQIGDVIVGKYRLSGLLGEGGMGTVWAAVNLQLESQVAIKVLAHREHDREILTLRLRQEAKATARLGHPAIVRVFDVGETERGDAFIVMELLKGQSLAARLVRAGRLPAVQTVQLLLPVADALSAAHGKGIVHRDLKPDNVFIVDDEDQLQPKLVDFGIAKVAAPTDESRLTQGDTVLGSPDYMSPEQARGLADVDHRTDIWSFCVVLYEALSGSTPFSGTNYNALLRSVIEDEPEPLSVSSPDAQELWPIIQRGLEKNRDARFATMTDLGRELALWLLGKGIAEDICGSSLESKWISRSNDKTTSRPVPEAFRSWPSLPPAQPPKSRSEDGAVSGDGPTLEAGADSPAVLTPFRRERSGSRPRFTRGASVAVGAIASIGIVSLLALNSPVRPPNGAEPSAPSSADISAARPTLEQGPAPSVPVDIVEPAPHPPQTPVVAPARSASVRPKAKSAQHHAPAPSGTPDTPPPRASDLLRPY